MDFHRTRLLAGVGGISASILLTQLAFSRILSVNTWYHFAFLAISLALLGLGAGGVLLHLTPRLHRLGQLHQRLFTYALLSSLSAGILAVVLLWTPLSYLAFRRGLLPLVLLLVVGTAPFLFGGLCLALIISRLHPDAGRLYAADLIGAALGCLLFVALIRYLGGGGVLVASSLLGALSAVCFGWNMGTRWKVLAGATGGVLALTILVQAATGFFDVAYPKSTEPVPAPLFAEWNMMSRVTVYPGQARETSHSATCEGPPPNELEVSIDSSASTQILIADDVEQVMNLKCNISALGYVAAPDRPRSLVIGPGGGRDVWTALAFDASSVVGVEINGLIAGPVLEDFETELGALYSRQNITLHVADGRSFIRASDEYYDIIQASLVDTWAATSAGAFALSENTLYTVEAFVDYFEHLTPDGVLSLSRWEGPETLRLISVARVAAERLGWSGIDDRLFVAADRTEVDEGRLANVLLKRSPLTSDEIDALHEFADTNDFEVLYSPGSRLTTYATLATSDDPKPVIAGYSQDISPVDDDRPFFFQTARVQSFPNFVERALQPGLQDGLFVLIRLAAITGLMVIAFLVGPLWLKRRDGDSVERLPTSILGFFALLGAGFMLLEVGLMQRFVLFLGHPSYSLTVVLFSLLIGAGLGSRMSRNRTNRLLGSIACGVAAAIGVLYALALPTVFDWTLAWSIQARIGLACVLLIPLGFVLGIPFPTAIRRVGTRQPAVLAWAWAINGAASVLGSVVAVLIAVTSGFRVVTLVGAAAYVTAAAISRRLVPDSMNEATEGEIPDTEFAEFESPAPSIT